MWRDADVNEEIAEQLATLRPRRAVAQILTDDSERYVQRSVANNLNDIGKDHPDVVVDVCSRRPRGKVFKLRRGEFDVRA